MKRGLGNEIDYGPAAADLEWIRAWKIGADGRILVAAEHFKPAMLSNRPIVSRPQTKRGRGGRNHRRPARSPTPRISTWP